MAKDDVKSSAFTLRFKYGRQTILLFAEPLTPFNVIKTQLLEVLQERYPDGLVSPSPQDSIPIPDSTDEITLGLPKDVYEPSKGWEELETGGNGLKDNPLGLGLKDGSIIAFTFGGAGKGKGKEPGFWVEWSTYDDQPMDEDEE